MNSAFRDDVFFIAIVSFTSEGEKIGENDINNVAV